MSNGYVYILEVRDIDLPVCKIGRTYKTPQKRCADINRSSTGDFLWQVAYEFSVSDCERSSFQHQRYFLKYAATNRTARPPASRNGGRTYLGSSTTGGKR